MSGLFAGHKPHVLMMSWSCSALGELQLCALCLTPGILLSLALVSSEAAAAQRSTWKGVAAGRVLGLNLQSHILTWRVKLQDVPSPHKAVLADRNLNLA